MQNPVAESIHLSERQDWPNVRLAPRWSTQAAKSSHSARQLRCERLIFMDQGNIVEQGPPKELLRSPQTARLQQFLGTWRSRQADLFA